MGIHKKMKGIVALLCIFSLLQTSLLSVQALETGQYVKSAETLKALGLFLGTSKGFELSKISTRAEAAVMLVRLLGVKPEDMTAMATPFTDVPGWANPYISYLYAKGFVKGITSTTYGSSKNVTGNQYMTMLLRALGYSDAEGLFKWNESIAFAQTVGLLGADDVKDITPVANSSMIRDLMAQLSYKSIFTKIRNTDQSLVMSLYENGVISADQMNTAKELDTQLAQILEGSMPDASGEEMRAVWITYIELQELLRNKSENDFRAGVQMLFEEVSNMGLNTVVVQVRPFADAIYPSEYFPWSSIISGVEGVNPGFDPLTILVASAHEQNLKFHAWINPFRIRSSSSKVVLSAGNGAGNWLADGSNRAIKIAEGTFYNPASSEVRELITAGVTEIIEGYAVDGIQFDDYFYPSTSLIYDKNEYTAYQQEGGALSQQAWRRENINLLVQSVYSAVKLHDSAVQFGISPQGSFEANYNQQFIDVAKWCSNTGYIDYICPQIYYGFNHSKYPYSALVRQWNDLMTIEGIELYVGLAPYKLGREDAWAGVGKREWIENTELLKNMVVEARKSSHFKGFSLYRMGSINAQEGVIQVQVKGEMESLKSLLMD